MATLSDEAKRTADAAEKLVHEVQRLRRDIKAVLSKLEITIREPAHWSLDAAPDIRSFKQAFDVIENSRREIRAAEFDIGAIRSTLDSLFESAIPREEMLEYLKTETPRE